MASWSKKIEFVKAKDLLIDPKVQRDVHPAQVRTLAREWDEMLVGTLTGWRKADGKVYLLDGQQRLRSKTGHPGVLKPMDPEYLFQVEVYEGITEAQAAHIFLGCNRGRKNVDAYARWWVEITEGNPIALAMEEAAKRCGLTISTNSNKHDIACVSTLRRVISRSKTDIKVNKAALVWALAVYKASFGYTPPWRSEMVEALAILKLVYPKIDTAKAIGRFSKSSVEGLLGRARARAVGSNRVSNVLAQVLQEEYDYNRRSGRLVPRVA